MLPAHGGCERTLPSLAARLRWKHAERCLKLRPSRFDPLRTSTSSRLADDTGDRRRGQQHVDRIGAREQLSVAEQKHQQLR